MLVHDLGLFHLRVLAVRSCGKCPGRVVTDCLVAQLHRQRQGNVITHAAPNNDFKRPAILSSTSSGPDHKDSDAFACNRANAQGGSKDSNRCTSIKPF